jgi:hypothetical protein
MDDSEDMDHWRVTLRNPANGKRMTLTFSKGIGHNGAEPTTAEVVECLASDASLIDNAPTFADFCAELGYDEDSRKAERTYGQCKRQAESFRRLMGSEYNATVYPSED